MAYIPSSITPIWQTLADASRNGGLFAEQFLRGLLSQRSFGLPCCLSPRKLPHPCQTDSLMRSIRTLNMPAKAFFSPSVAGAAPSILQRLRIETRDAHVAIEETLALTQKTLTLGAYRQVLESFYGFYKPVEDAIAAVGNSMPVWLDVAARRKTALLEVDLQHLGLPGASALPLCKTLPPLGKLAQRMGCLYVLEGATLGGVLISRHIRENLGVFPESGGRFFYGYGPSTGVKWNEFRAGLLSFASVAPHEEDLVIATARATFETLRHWCEMGKER